jgi:hypothetical protein
MVASQQKEIFWILDFVGEQQTNSRNAEIASIYVVS